MILATLITSIITLLLGGFFMGLSVYGISAIEAFITKEERPTTRIMLGSVFIIGIIFVITALVGITNLRT